MLIGNKEFDVAGGCYIMGILNVTPDSFSDGGLWNGTAEALDHESQMIDEGASIIDVGGESTRPGYTVIDDDEEIARVVPVIEVIKREHDIPVSIDTYKSNVAKAALEAGADMVNDIWGFKHDPAMAAVASRYGAACCLMHNREKTIYRNFMEDVCTELGESIAIAKAAGIPDDKIILDPGVGFAKSQEQNLQITNHLDVLGQLGYPLLLGASRKSMIGNVLDLPASERLEGTLATTMIGIMRGCSFFRVHDVKENRRVIDMALAILAG